MKVSLLANQPEKTTRLQMFKGTLQKLGYEVVVPGFGTRNWVEIARQAREFVKHQKPDVIHIFNVPDIIYHGLPKLKGTYYSKLIYDYRSPWGVEYGISFGPIAERVCEHFEHELVAAADLITAPNRPLGNKAMSYKKASGKPIFIVPNYTPRGFAKTAAYEKAGAGLEEDEKAIIFVGRISKQEGIGNLLRLAREIPDQRFWIVGDGPFARFYLHSLPPNVKFFGWQTRERVAYLISRANMCLIVPDKTKITPYATEKSIWKLNEYLSLGKMVIASGITVEEKRKNLVVVDGSQLKNAILENIDKEPERMNEEDYRHWELNDRVIKEAYKTVCAQV